MITPVGRQLELARPDQDLKPPFRNHGDLVAKLSFVIQIEEFLAFLFRLPMRGLLS
jgi:hypothetical protein